MAKNCRVSRKNLPLTHERLKELLNYDPETGTFTRLKHVGPRLGGKVGAIRNKYFEMSIDGKIYKAHRLAFYLMTGRWPVNGIDHINGNSLDNRWSNLRECNQSQNQANRSLYFSKNRTGYKGVTEKLGKYGFQIGVAGKRISRYGYKTAEEASKAYEAESVRHFGPFARQDRK